MPALALLVALTRGSMLDALSASPDAPAIEFGWRGSLRGKAGARIPFLEPGLDQQGWLFDLPFFVELYNHEGAVIVVPYEYWRGRFALEAGYRWALPPRGWLLGVKLAAEHESDHATAQYGGFFGYVTANDLALAVTAQHLGRSSEFIVLTNRLHLLTCSESQYSCDQQGGLGGDRTWEIELAVTERFALGSSEHWYVFGSADADFRLGTAQIATERRLAARVGITARRTTDWFSFAFVALVGSDVGYFRQLDVHQLGFVVGWSPFT